MDSSSIKAVLGDMVLILGLAALVVAVCVPVCLWVASLPARIGRKSKLMVGGMVTALVLGLMAAHTVLTASPNRLDKDEDQILRGIQQGETEAWGAAMGLDGKTADGLRNLAGGVSDGTDGGADGGGGTQNGGTPSRLSTATTGEQPTIRSLTASDYAAGVALAGIGVNEAFDFSPPGNAEVCSDWTAFGAAVDWI